VIENAFAASTVLIVEVDMRNVDHLEMMEWTATSGTYPADDDLYKHISAETRSKLDTYLNANGIPPALFSRFRPWLAGVTVSMLPMINAGLNPDEGIDLYFLNKAGGKRVEQLEDAQWQLKLVSGLPDSLADHWLTNSIAQAEHWKDDWTKLELYWSTGAATKLDDLASRDEMVGGAEERRYERTLREDRNPHMTDRLEKCLHSSDSCFMVVGAAHVVGKEGIVKQLQSRGYRVEQAVVEGSPTSAAAAK
jgi:uncharacterized protein YbaP (TraB family)